MTETNQDKQQPETSDQPSVKSIQPAEQAKNQSAVTKSASMKNTSAVTWLALLIAAVAIAASVYLWQNAVNTQQQLTLNIATVEQRFADQNAVINTLQQSMAEQTAQNDQQQRNWQQTIEQLQKQLSSQQKRLLSLSTTDRQDWLLAEAEYLMRLANQRLLMGKEVKGALKLLTAADDIMVELDDAALYKIRKALAEDMTALRVADRFDVEKTYLQLAAVSKQVDSLKLFEPVQSVLTEPQQAAPENWQGRLEHGFLSAWEKLKNYIQIKRRDDIYRPLLAPEYEAAVRQNVRLMIEQAQMALLAGKQTLYESSLDKASQWLTDYYTLDQQATRSVLEIISNLKQQQVVVELPDISASLRALKQYLETVHDVAAKKNIAKTLAEQDQGEQQ